MIKQETFKEWMGKNFDKDEMEDIVEHGADYGYHHLTYYTDTIKLHDKFEDEIWNKLSVDGDAQGLNIMQFIASLGGAEWVGDLTQFKNLLVWYMAEETARELTEED